MVPLFLLCCFQWFKDTNLKANHNYRSDFEVSSCFQWFKDTNLKSKSQTWTSSL